MQGRVLGCLKAFAIVAAAWLVSMVPALANCVPIAQQQRLGLMRASMTLAQAPPEHVRITFLGHSSFLIDSPEGVKIVTDYNDYIRAPVPPDIVTMNNTHSTHYTEAPDPRIPHALRGWGTEQKLTRHDVRLKDVRVRNIPTNVRDWSGGTRYNGNSIFIYEVAALCIAHLAHLHHLLEEERRAELGQIDIMMLPIDGALTMGQQDMATVINQIKPTVILPMHYFSGFNLNRFLDRMRATHKVTLKETPVLEISRAKLPTSLEIIVLPGT
jgi:L-ascorbate metabolism protein UlaG (beta-lactamase superfamily)